MPRPPLIERLAGSAPSRAVADALLGRFARRRVRELDALDVAEAQKRTLLRLVRRARDTRFGKDHGFDAIRTIADYQQRVPIRDYEAFWRDYWQPAFPRIDDVTWLGFTPYFALSSGTTTGKTKYIPVTRHMVRSNKKAALTLTSLYLTRCPDAGLCRGRAFFLGGSTDLKPLENGALTGDLSGIATREVPPAARAFGYPPEELALLEDWESKVEILARESARLPITLITGVPAWLLTFFDRLKQVTGAKTVAEAWPMLKVIVHGGCRFDPYRPVFREVVGSDDVCLIDTYPASEGYIATEDPRHGLLRLIPDHGIFFEFVPVDELASERPTRHTVAEVQPGVQYAVILTTCAGLWSYTLGDTVAFESRDPPLLRVTGRTKYTLSAFGEHLISEEVERAVAAAAESCGATVLDFHVGPVFPPSPAQPGHHRFLVEFGHAPADPAVFARALDRELQAANATFAAYRVGDVSLAPPEVVAVPHGGFGEWMKSKGKAGGQHKLPRMDGTGRLTEEMMTWFRP